MEGDYYMSNLTSAINVNVPTDVKREATNLFNSLGISMSTAINMFLKKSIYECGIPFDLKQEPSKEVIEALKEIEDIENGNSNKIDICFHGYKGEVMTNKIISDYPMFSCLGWYSDFESFNKRYVESLKYSQNNQNKYAFI